MKVLPSYLIEYMLYIEDAIEELKLSVYDHAYDLLKALDVDELTSDEIRQKLELYDIKVENMSESWLPNGRFYRIYPSIRYNRTRLNDLQSVVKSGGQFEGLWSNDFSTKTEYNYRYIQMVRHYTSQSTLDGYFYISGDTSITSTGVVSDSAVTALSSDILIDQAMPAGYTYLYVPWPMPHYPNDAGSFYNPHMLMADRLHFTEACSHYWEYVGIDNGDSDERVGNKVYVCMDNSDANRYCSVSDSDTDHESIVYCSQISEITVDDHTEYVLISPHTFTEIAGDKVFSKEYNLLTESTPASENYHWNTGDNTPYRASYWIDYHYMNDNITSPIEERGLYYTEDNLQTDPASAIRYELDGSCKELGDSNSVFPTYCWTNLVFVTTEPSKDVAADFDSFDGLYNVTLYSVGTNSASIKNYLVNNLNKTSDEADSIISNLPSVVAADLSYDEAIALQDNINAISLTENYVYADSTMSSKSLDMSYPGAAEDDFGPYRYDLLSTTLCGINENLNHIKAINAFWSDTTAVYTLFNMFSVSQDSTAENRKLYYWMNFRTDPDDSSIVYLEEYTDNPQPIINADDDINVIFTNISDHTGDNVQVSSTTSSNKLYNYRSSQNRFDPTLSYSIVNIGTYNTEDDRQELSSPYNAYIEVGVQNRFAYLNVNSSPINSYINYVTYTTSPINRLWFSSLKEDFEINSAYSRLYNDCGNDEIYLNEDDDDNSRSFKYNIISVYKLDGSLAQYDPSKFSFGCYLSGSKYTAMWVTNPVEVTDADVFYNPNSPQWQPIEQSDLSYIPTIDTDNYTVFKGAVNPSVTNIKAEFDYIFTKNDIIDTISLDSSRDAGWHPVDQSASPQDTELPDIGAPSNGPWSIFRSDIIEHGTQATGSTLACLLVNVDVSSTTDISFKICVSSESNFDYLRVYLDQTINSTFISSYLRTPSAANDPVIQDAKISGTAGSWVDITISNVASGNHQLLFVYSKDYSTTAGKDCGWVAFNESACHYNSETSKYIGFIGNISQIAATFDICLNVESDSGANLPIKISHLREDSVNEHTDVYIDDATDPSSELTGEGWLDVSAHLSKGEHLLTVVYKKYHFGLYNYGLLAIPNELIDTTTMRGTITRSVTPQPEPFEAAYVLFTSELIDSVPTQVLEYEEVAIEDSVTPKIAYGANIGDNDNSNIVVSAIKVNLGESILNELNTDESED